MLSIQKNNPFIEIIHHPITFDFKFELAASKKIKYKYLDTDGIHFKNAKRLLQK